MNKNILNVAAKLVNGKLENIVDTNKVKNRIRQKIITPLGTFG